MFQPIEHPQHSQPLEAVERQKMPPMERHAQKKSLRRILMRPSVDGSKLHDIEYFRVVDPHYHPGMGWCSPFQAKVVMGMLKEPLPSFIYLGVAAAVRNDGLAYYYVSHYHEPQRAYSGKVAHSVAVGRAVKLALGHDITKVVHKDDCAPYVHTIRTPNDALLHKAILIKDGKVLEGRALRSAVWNALLDQGVVHHPSKVVRALYHYAAMSRGIPL